MRFIIYRDPVGQWRWTYEVNGRPLAEGGLAHPTPARCLEDIAQIRSAHLSPVSVSPFPRTPIRETTTTRIPRDPTSAPVPVFGDGLEADKAPG